MLRISWPLAFLVAGAIAVVARKPRLFPWILGIFVVWFLVQTARRRDGKP